MGQSVVSQSWVGRTTMWMDFLWTALKCLFTVFSIILYIIPERVYTPLTKKAYVEYSPRVSIKTMKMISLKNHEKFT